MFQRWTIKVKKKQCNSSNEQSNTACTRNNKNKNCQAEIVICGQGSQQKDMQLDKSAMLIQHKMPKKQKQVQQEDDKNC